MSVEYQQVPSGSVPTVALLLTRPSSCCQLREFLEAYVARVKRVKAKVGTREDNSPKRSAGNFDERSRPRVGIVRHAALFLPDLGVTGKQDARRAMAKEDGYRVVVGLGEELVGRRGDDILDNSTRRRSLPLVFSGARGGRRASSS
jgi:hypothetical protein